MELHVDIIPLVSGFVDLIGMLCSLLLSGIRCSWARILWIRQRAVPFLLLDVIHGVCPRTMNESQLCWDNYLRAAKEYTVF